MQKIRTISAGSGRTTGETKWSVDLFIDLKDGGVILEKLTQKEAVILAEQLMNAVKRCQNGNQDLDENLMNREDKAEAAANRGMTRSEAMAHSEYIDLLLCFPNKQMTVDQYATKTGVSPQAVTERIRRKSYPKGVKHVSTVGRSYLLNVCSEELC